jgi:N-acetyl-anhydromuramyl-L-alanine amidase AmpD
VREFHPARHRFQKPSHRDRTLVEQLMPFSLNLGHLRSNCASHMVRTPRNNSRTLSIFAGTNHGWLVHISMAPRLQVFFMLALVEGCDLGVVESSDDTGSGQDDAGDRDAAGTQGYEPGTAPSPEADGRDPGALTAAGIDDAGSGVDNSGLEDAEAWADAGLVGMDGMQGAGSPTDPLTALSVMWHQAAAVNYTIGREGASIQYIVIHDTEELYADTIQTFQDPARQASAHYVIRSSDGAVVQMVSNANTAWHCGNWYFNTHSIGIEHEGWMRAPQRWYTEAMYQSSARLVARLARTYHVPVDREHIVGHYQVVVGGGAMIPACSGSQPWSYCILHDNNNHQDPGPGWNWDHYLALVRQYLPESAVGDPPACPAGTYPLWTCNADRSGRVRCIDGMKVETERCPTGCITHPVGVDDVCASG